MTIDARSRNLFSCKDDCPQNQSLRNTRPLDCSNKPLCIDLFCGLGLGQPEFCLSAYSAIQKLVTCRAKNPNHVRLSVLYFPPRAVSAVFRTMCQFHNSGFQPQPEVLEVCSSS